MSAQTSIASGDPPVLSNGGQPSSPPARANQAPSTPTLNSKLWKEAYDRLDQELKQGYEAIIKADLNIGRDANLEQQSEALVRARKQRVENRQWTVKWRGRSIKIKSQVDTILNVIQKTADIISFPMQFAPPYVSLPWTAVTILLPVSDACFVNGNLYALLFSEPFSFQNQPAGPQVLISNAMPYSS